MHSAATFREHFPEFSAPGLVTDGQIGFWLSVADAALRESVWGGLWDQGCELYVAHHLAIAMQDTATADAGGAPGQVNGPTTSKAVGSVSKSMDAGAVTHAGAGHWNLTSYGVRLYNLIRLVGAGGVQV